MPWADLSLKPILTKFDHISSDNAMVLPDANVMALVFPGGGGGWMRRPRKCPSIPSSHEKFDDGLHENTWLPLVSPTCHIPCI
jgi:hypothetical protein